MSKRKEFDWDEFWAKVMAGAVVFGILLVIIGGVIWIRAAMPCSWLDWMPAAEVPTRCLAVDVR